MRILLVEDNAALAENLKEIFADAGYEVTHVADGASALDAAPKGFDLGVLDVRLPDMLGTALLPKLRDLQPDAELVVTTGNADVESAVQAVRGGAFAYLTKPVSVEELLRTAARALERVELRRRALELQDALARSERRHRGIVESVPAMILAVDRELRIRFANRAVEELTGWSRDDLLGKDLLTVFSPLEQREDRRAKLHAAFERPSVAYEVDFLHRDGETLRVQLRWARQPGAAEDWIWGTGLDVTRQRELERQARTSEKLAAVGTLAAGLAHEVRNPLNAALLQLALLARRIGKLEGPPRPELEEPVALVRAELGRLEGLLADFLAFARPRDYGRRALDLREMLAKVVALHVEAAKERGLSLLLHAPARLDVAGEEAALQQVAVNLVQNALDAARGEVRVSLYAEDGWAVLAVDDDGAGIPPALAAKIFEPFFTTKAAGTGLGLAIVHTIVAGHGGEISLEARYGGGTRARVRLPLA